MAQAPHPAADRAFFGHPRGLGFLLGAECGWAFGFYGLQNMLTLYMTGQLLKPGHVEHVWGFAAYRAALEHVTGPLGAVGLASQTFGLATSLIYALPVLGGLVADRWIGQRRAAVCGLAVLMAAHLLLIHEPAFLVAVLLIVLGTGLLKTSLVGQIGRLYAVDDDRRTRGFGLYLIALNTGSFLTPLIAGTLAERVSWGTAFTAMAVGMGLGVVCYLAGLRHTPPDAMRARAASGPGAAAAPRARLSGPDARVVFALLALALADGVWQGVYNQAFNVFPVWAEAHVQRHVAGFLVPVTWFSTLDGVFTIAGAAVAVRIWAWRRGPGGAAADTRRVLVGLVLAIGAYLVLALASAVWGRGQAPLALPVLFFLLVDFSIPWIDTTILTMISRDAPAAVASTLLGLYYLSTAFGNLLTGWLGGLADHLDMTAFWLVHAGCYVALLAVVLAARPRLVALLGAREAAAEAEPAAAPAA